MVEALENGWLAGELNEIGERVGSTKYGRFTSLLALINLDRWTGMQKEGNLF